MRWLAFFLVLTSSALAQHPGPVAKSTVFYAMDTTAISPMGTVHSATVQRMVDSLVGELTGQRTPGAAWATLVKPDDVVGIKVAASGRTVSGTRPEVVLAVARGLAEAGVSPANIIVWDKNHADLVAAGYDTTGTAYQIEGVDPTSGYDRRAQVSAPVIGKLIWGDSKFGDRKVSRFSDMLTTTEQLSSTSFFCHILSSQVTKVINIPSLTDSFLTGVNGAFVNMTLSNLDNWRRFAKSAAAGDSYIAEIYLDPLVHDKVVLTILDGLVLQYAGGPFPDPNFAVQNFSLFASLDPVAIDATAVRLIDELRVAHKLPPVRPMTAYLEAARELGLGQSAEPRIDMIRVGVEGIR